ncbi:MAG: hypothetical protein ACYDEA_11035 [Candidatus Dormibacteria bacterium]
MTGNAAAGSGPDQDDPNRTVRGARQRFGPFWIDEPRWFWVVEGVTLLLAITLLALAIGFDHP